MKIIINKPWEYTFYEQNDHYFINVLCGDVALFEFLLELNAAELEGYQSSGEHFINELAEKVRFSPASYLDRRKESS